MQAGIKVARVPRQIVQAGKNSLNYFDWFLFIQWSIVSKLGVEHLH